MKKDYYICSKNAEMFLYDEDIEHINIIYSLPEDKKMINMRNKSISELQNMLLKFKKFIISNIKNEYKDDAELFLSNQNNKKFADLYCMCKKKILDIEIKFGKETNSNIGMKSFNKIIDDNMVIKNLLSKKVREEWKSMMIAENLNEEKQLSRLIKGLNEIVDYYNQNLKGKFLSKEQTMFLNNNIINNSGSSDYNCNNYIKYVCDGNGKFYRKKIKIFKDNNFKIGEVHKLDINKFKRFIIPLYNDHNERISLTLNWKNNTHLKDGRIITSRCGIISPSWNVDVGELIDEE